MSYHWSDIVDTNFAPARLLDPGPNKETYKAYRECKALGASKVKEICKEVQEVLEELKQEKEDATTEEMTDSDTTSDDTESDDPVE